MSTDRFTTALQRIDATHAEDPRREGGEPLELVYARRMSAWLERLVPEASEALRLAVRAQHLRRWTVPRADYPEGREGYRAWRTTLARMHAEAAGAIVREAGYDEATVARVQALIRKEGIKRDPETQALEDAACLVFLEHQLDDFARQHAGEEDKLLKVLGNTWAKMSGEGRTAALGLALSEHAQVLLRKALAGLNTP